MPSVKSKASQGDRAFAVAAPSLGSLSTRVFETRTATGSELFSLLTCLHTTTLTLPSIFSPLEMISIKMFHCPGTRNVLFQLPSASQKRASLSSLLWNSLPSELRSITCVKDLSILNRDFHNTFANYLSISFYHIVYIF